MFLNACKKKCSNYMVTGVYFSSNSYFITESVLIKNNQPNKTSFRKKKKSFPSLCITQLCTHGCVGIAVETTSPGILQNTSNRSVWETVWLRSSMQSLLAWRDIQLLVLVNESQTKRSLESSCMLMWFWISVKTNLFFYNEFLELREQNNSADTIYDLYQQLLHL